jgi:hypothetical protein
MSRQFFPREFLDDVDKGTTLSGSRSGADAGDNGVNKLLFSGVTPGAAFIPRCNCILDDGSPFQQAREESHAFDKRRIFIHALC